jgi:hypothetical protein
MSWRVFPLKPPAPRRDRARATVRSRRKWGSAILFGILVCIARSAISADNAAFINYEWPMDKYGNHWITLSVPRAIAGMDVVACAQPDFPTLSI